MANEKRLIDANALMEKHCEGCVKGVQEMCKSDPVCATMMWVVEEPTVDAVEVVHGRWLFVTKGQQTSVYVCSKCNRAVTVVCDEDKIKEQLAKRYPYCHCGAKMDGDGNE